MKYTVWVCEPNGRGTTHVSSHEADTPKEAAEQAVSETTADWDWDATTLHVLGIAEGDVNLIEWNDIDE